MKQVTKDTLQSLPLLLHSADLQVNNCQHQLEWHSETHHEVCSFGMICGQAHGTKQILFSNTYVASLVVSAARPYVSIWCTQKLSWHIVSVDQTVSGVQCCRCIGRIGKQLRL